MAKTPLPESYATQIRLASRPAGAPTISNFEIAQARIARPTEGEILVRTLYLSVDPSLRPRMNAVSEYAGAIGLHEVIPSSAIGVVVASGSPDFQPGDHVFGMLNWQTHATIRAAEVRRIDPSSAPLPKWLSLLGLSSFTAYIGITELARPKAGETVVVSAATGATGAAAGQIARITGARTVGIAGGPEKCRYAVDRLGYDASVDYKAPDFGARLDAACPDGIDVDYENVGGDVLKAVFARMNTCGRIVVCGLVSEYSSEDGWMPGPSLWPAVYKSLRIEGFRASRYFDRIPEFVEKALVWADAGLFVHHECITDGIANAPLAFVELLSGRHLGKAMVKV